METSPHCTVSAPRRRNHLLGTLLLTGCVLLVHGYHPWAEDGGLYIAGVEYTLNPQLFPQQTPFVIEHLHYSLFAPALATLTRLSHLSLASVLLLVYLVATALSLWAAGLLAARCFSCSAARWAAVSLFAAWWTLPVAGTSLLLMDPYVTARSISMPFSLLAAAAALVPWELRSGSPWRARRTLWCVLALLVAAAFHPLMAAYTLEFVLFLRLQRRRSPGLRSTLLALALLSSAGCLQLLARPESPSAVHAVFSRYYWFLSQWHWYEWLGLLAPLGIFRMLLARGRALLSDDGRHLCRTALWTGGLALVTASTFAREHELAFPVARLQPLRSFLLLYALMSLLLGGTLAEWIHLQHRPSRLFQTTPFLAAAAMAIPMFLVQRATFPASLHVELPGRRNPNSWVQAFLWAREHTPNDALFALDARYINTPGEDAQTFRAISQRSAIPDFSKDGGEAAISPALAPAWQAAALATQHLSSHTDQDRLLRLQPFHVQWLVLQATAQTRFPCPYQNVVVKICALAPETSAGPFR